MNVTLNQLQDWNACKNVLGEMLEKLGRERLESGVTLLESLDAGISVRTVVWVAVHLSPESRIAFLRWMADCTVRTEPIFELRPPGSARVGDAVTLGAAAAAAKWTADPFVAADAAWAIAAVAWVAAAAKAPAEGATTAVDDAAGVVAAERQMQHRSLRAWLSAASPQPLPEGEHS